MKLRDQVDKSIVPLDELKSSLSQEINKLQEEILA
jgi:hypothetical protein